MSGRRTLEDTRILGAPDELATFDSIVTQDPRLLACIDHAASAAKTDMSVLLLGESGTGKNLLAEALHRTSCRCGGPCVTVNCAALHDSLIESELFGHERGAYTGAHRHRRGRFESAQGGTLVLDEVAELSPSAQAKLLQAVETKRYERVGGDEQRHADVRIVSLTNADLAQRIAGKAFRADLLYRLQEIRIELPPLRERKGDIPLLVRKFVEHYNGRFGAKVEGASDAAMNRLLAHNWPGNVRELQTAVKRGVTSARNGRIEVEDLGLGPDLALQPGQPAPGAGAAEPGRPEPTGDLSLAAAELRHIRWVMELVSGNKRHAAQRLHISRTTLDKKLGAGRKA